MSEVHEGGCLCRAIRYRVKGNPLRAYVCHCTFCQRRTGSAFGIIVWIEEENFELTGDGITTYQDRSERNRWVRLHFCNRCGTTVMMTTEGRPGVRFMMVGTFDDPNWVKFDRHTWTRSAQHWVVIPQNVDCYEKGGGKPLEPRPAFGYLRTSHYSRLSGIGLGVPTDYYPKTQLIDASVASGDHFDPFRHS